jgi:hypothetical protein
MADDTRISIWDRKEFARRAPAGPVEVAAPKTAPVPDEPPTIASKSDAPAVKLDRVVLPNGTVITTNVTPPPARTPTPFRDYPQIKRKSVYSGIHRASGRR